MEDGEIEEGAVVPADEEEDGPSVLDRKPEKSPYEMLYESKASVEKIVAEILSIKKEGKSKPNLREPITQMFLNFVTLRQANRSILLEEDRVKAETERAKTPVDFTTLQLHNLMYEKSHYLKAIKACKDFKSKYPDIELVDEEEFFRDAPEDIKRSNLSKDNAHSLMMQRLNFELFQRKELCKLREKLEQHKKSLLETIANRKRFLSSLPSHLKSLKKASLPVQNQLGIQHTKKIKQHQAAELLPPPLYVLYSQLLAQKEAFGENIELEIVGSLKDAQVFSRQQANKDTGIAPSLEGSRLEDDAPDEEEDGQRRRKRPRRNSGKENADQGGAYQVHPLKVILQIHDDDVSDPKSLKLITLKFEYLLKLNVVCVGIEASHEGPENDILCNLFPDDTGLELPHQSAKLYVGSAVVFDGSKTSRPYKWAQHLAGIDFLPEMSPLLLAGHETSVNETTKIEDVISGLSLYRQQSRVQTILQRIRSRKKAQLALVDQLESLKKLKWPVLSCQSVPWASHIPLCNLHGWSLVGTPSNQASSVAVLDTEHIQEPMDVDIVERSRISKEVLESAREDGELPSLTPAASVASDDKPAALKESNLDHGKQLALISKSITPPVKKVKSVSFKKYDEGLDLILDIESDIDEPAPVEPETENVESTQYLKKAGLSWMDCGVQKFCLVLSRKMDTNEKNINLEAKVKISTEYPLRPPVFMLSLSSISAGENQPEIDDFECYNELRAMEAEVNLHMLKMIPSDQHNHVLSHQVCFLAMLFDYSTDNAAPSDKRNFTSVLDVGLCKPTTGRLLARSFRGRDRRKMISWKDNGCSPGCPS